MANYVAMPKLKGREDYQNWKFAAEATLDVDGLWDVVAGSESETDATKLAVLNRKARSRLILMIEPINYVHVSEETSAKGVWDKLKAAFEDSGLMRRVGLLRTLITTKLEQCNNMEDFVNRIISTANKLNGAGMKLDDEWIGTLLLAGLSSRYEPMIMAIESSGVKISSDQIKTKLLQETVTASDGNSTGESSMFTHTRHGQQTQQHHNTNKSNYKPGQGHQGQRSVMKCFKCGKVGHFSRDCRSSKPTGPNKGGHGRNESNWSCTTGQYDRDAWYLDSGATAHMTKNADLVVEMRASSSGTVTVANQTELKVEGEGVVKLKTLKSNVSVSQVLVVPEICANLLSVSGMVRKGMRLVFDSRGCSIEDECSGVPIATATEVNGLYRLEVTKPASGFLTQKGDSAIVWHRRLAHTNFEMLRRLDHQLKMHHDGGMPHPCEICVLGKHTRLPFGKSSTKSTSVLELVHSDVCGPMQVSSLQASRYFVTFIDDFSKRVVVYGIETKSMVLKVFKDFRMKAENHTGKKIRTLRSDNGGEYCNGAMKDYLRSAGIVHQTTVPYNPEQNGVAERMNRTLVEKARCMLFDAKMPTKFWAEAVVTAAFITNRLPSQENKMSPEEIWSKKRPELSGLRVFGCKAMALIPTQKRSKFDPKSKSSIFIGYCTTTKGYRLYDPESGKIFVSRDVKFFENQQGVEPKTKEVNYPNFSNFYFIENKNEVEENTDPMPIDDGNVVVEEDDSFEEEDNFADADYTPDVDVTIPTSTTPRRSNRTRQPVNNYMSNVVEVTSTTPDPATINEALSGKNAEHWQCAINDEMSSLQANRTWSLVDLPTGRKAIANKWVFKTKIGGDGRIDKFKARLVIKGCAQREGIDYEETFSPVVRYSTVRYLIALAAKYDMDIDHMDAVTAFLQGDLKEEVYMQQPIGMEDGTKRVCRLNKSLYGLKQASRTWNEKLNCALINAGLTCSRVDTCVYFKVNDESITIVAVYVDDLLIISNNVKEKNHIKAQLNKNFKMTDNGAAKFFLGMHISRDRQAGTIKISQQKYLREVLERFGMSDCNPVTTPADVNVKLSGEMAPDDEMEKEQMRAVPYQEAVGSLLFAAQVSRPDIQFAVNLVSRFNQKYGRPHWNAVKRIMRYLQGTLDKGITYSSGESKALHGYCDADWASDSSDRRSVTGYVFLLQGGAITWNSKKQPTVALSTTEAEYMAMSTATQEAIWLRNFYNELFGPRNKITQITIYGDNKSAIQLSEKPTQFHPRTKHIDIRHHFIRNNVSDGIVCFTHTPTQNMRADFLTKPVSHEIHKQCSEGINLK